MIIRTLRGAPRRKAGVVALAVLTFGILVTLAVITTPPNATDPASNPGSPAASTTQQASVAPGSPLAADRTSSTDQTLSADPPVLTRQKAAPRSFSPLRYGFTVLLLAAAAGSAYYLRSRRRDKPAGSAITLIDRHPIRQGQEIRLLRIGDSDVLVGVSPNQITLLSERPTSRADVAAPRDQDATASAATRPASTPAPAHRSVITTGDSRFEKALAAARSITTTRVTPTPAPTVSPDSSVTPRTPVAPGTPVTPITPGVYPTLDLPVGSTIGVTQNPSAIGSNHA